MLSPRTVPDHTYLMQSMHSNLLCSHQQSWAGPLLLRKRALDITHSMTADRSMGPYPVSLQSQPMTQWGQSQPSVDGGLLGLPDLYYRHVIGTFNNCSWEPTHRSLTDTGRGYNHWGVSLPHHTPWPFQPTVLRFPPKCPARSQIIHPTITN
jgi:hypothetical protein